MCLSFHYVVTIVYCTSLKSTMLTGEVKPVTVLAVLSNSIEQSP